MKWIKHGLLLFALGSIFVFFFRDGDFAKKVFFMPVDHLKTKNDHLYFPVVKSDGNIYFTIPDETGGVYHETIELEPEQVIYFDNIGMCNEVSYDFNFFNGIRQGHLTIKDDSSGTKNIIIYLHSVSRLNFDYVAKYKLTSNNLTIVEARSIKMILLLLVITFSAAFSSIIVGGFFIAIGVFKSISQFFQKHASA